MYCISSLTETAGFMSPRSGVVFAIALGDAAGDVAAGVDGFDGEHDETAARQNTKTAANAARECMRFMRARIVRSVRLQADPKSSFANSLRLRDTTTAHQARGRCDSASGLPR